MWPIGHIYRDFRFTHRLEAVFVHQRPAPPVTAAPPVSAAPPDFDEARGAAERSMELYRVQLLPAQVDKMKNMIEYFEKQQ